MVFECFGFVHDASLGNAWRSRRIGSVLPGAECMLTRKASETHSWLMIWRSKALVTNAVLRLTPSLFLASPRRFFTARR